MSGSSAIAHKILVTGATGFIGQHLVPRLLNENCSVKCLARASSIRPPAFADKVEWVIGDINDPQSLKDACRDVEIVIHLAGTIKASDPLEFIRGNAQGTTNLLNAIESVNNKVRFIYISSLSAAGPSNHWQPKTEEDPAYPISLYGQSKLQAEIEVLKRKNRLWVAIIRPSVVYGPGDKETLIFYKTAKSWFKPRLSDHAKRVSMIYVADLVELIWLLCQSDIPSGEIFFAADNREQGYSWEEIIAEAARHFPRRRLTIYVPYFLLQAAFFIASRFASWTRRNSMLNRDKYEELRACCWTCSAAKARQMLSFQPQYDLRRGIDLAIKWYKEQQWL